VVRFLPFLISLVLSVYALFSCIQTRDEDVPYLPKLVWIVLIVLVPFVGPIVWLLMVRTTGAVRGERPVRPATTPGRPIAPDDDPDFLASLERYRDPRTTVRPPAPGDSAKPKAKDKPDAGGAADESQAKDETAKDKKAKDKKPRDTESGAPTESDDGKP
jgi:hypothetical protein